VLEVVVDYFDVFDIVLLFGLVLCVVDCILYMVDFCFD